MFQYKAADTAITLDIMQLVETLPTYSTVEEVMSYDKTAHLGSDRKDGTIFLISENRNLCGIDGVVLYIFFSDRQLAGVVFQAPNVSFVQYLEMINSVEVMTKTKLKFAMFKGAITDVTSLVDERNADLAYTDSTMWVTTEYESSEANTLIINDEKNYNYDVRAIIYGENTVKFYSQPSMTPVHYGEGVSIFNEMRISIGFPGQI